MAACALAAWGASIGPSAALGPDGLRPTLPSVPSADRKRETASELEALRREIGLSAERQEALRREIDALDKDQASLLDKAVAVARRVQILEKSLTDTESRVLEIDRDRSRLEESLRFRHAALADVLAAVERIGRNPPPALVVRPDAALDAVRGAMLFGAVLPGLKEETEALAADVAALVNLRQRAAAERETYRADLSAIAEERARLELLIEERRRARSEQAKRLEEEKRRAADLAAKAESLKDLIARLERDLDSARRAAEAARLAPAAPPDPKGPSEPPRLQPALAFDAARGALPKPVEGAIIKHFGEADGLGGVTRGIYISARSGARATSPCDGWVVYAGPFRSYGQLLIINAGGGYHVVLAGMERIEVDLGQFVLTGEPVATMGDRRLASVRPIEAGSHQPVLYVEFRKDGAPVDPAPWWAPT